ncbi:hypothetical protein GG344DRAFT_71415 [Lentinula edodes]|nr:hypothetical protein GG344DRAFT_71415 [Lentinula edodes]
MYDETTSTVRSKGIFTRSSIDIEVLIEELRYTIFSEAQNEEHARHKLIQDQQVYNSYEKLSIGTKDDPIDVDDVEVCADCSQEIDSNIHKDLCLGTYEVE